jgi:hypothetical protein
MGRSCGLDLGGSHEDRPDRRTPAPLLPPGVASRTGTHGEEGVIGEHGEEEGVIGGRRDWRRRH